MDPNLQLAVNAIADADATMTQLKSALAVAQNSLSNVQSQLTAAQADDAADEAKIASLSAEVARLQAIIDAATPTTPPTEPPPTTPPATPPTQPPSTSDFCLIGMSSPADDWAQYKSEVEATGGKLEARRFFYGNINSDPTQRVKECVAQNLVPVVSFKTEPYSWADVAAGKADSVIKARANQIKAVLGDKKYYIAFHHEPDKQADPKDVGEGGSGADFARMQARIPGLVKSVTPNAEVGVIMNGWWWSAQSRGFSDAEINVWLPKATRDQLDWIGADDYNQSASAGEKAVDRIKRRCAWMDRAGYTGYTGVGETNSYTPEDLNATFNFAKTDKHFKNGFICIWNSTATGPDTYLKNVGLLDDFQKILANWHK